jgi:hypothetical protein
MVYFIVEGSTDRALVETLLSDVDNDAFKFLGLKGYGGVKKTLDNLTESDLSNNTYFAIVDADNSFINRETELKILTRINKVEFYIFPNHNDNGDLETLLLSGITNNEIIECFEKYKSCIKIYNNENIDNKSKLYAYTTLEFNQKPDEYIKGLNTNNTVFNELKTKLKDLFNE